MKNLVKAILAVMKEVKSIDKNMTVGTGNSSYSGVSDKDVKQVFNDAMCKNGLVMLPISIDANTEVTRWEQEQEWNGKKEQKQKQQVFVEVRTKYLLIHESGESVEISGYGHGVDSQDKAAGKATTYAMKYALLYSFITPTGKIDDTDNTHSEEIPTASEKNNPWLNPGTPEWSKALEYLQDSGTIDKIKTKYNISKVNQEKIQQQAIS